MRYAVRALTVLIAVPLIYFAVALLGALIPGESAAISGPPTARIALVRGPIHYDLLLPLTPRIRQTFAFAERAGVPVNHVQAQWLIVGWGAEGVYTTMGSFADASFAALWRGVTGDASVIRLDVAGQVSAFPGITYLSVSDAQLAALVAAVEASFARNAAGGFVPSPSPGFGTTDAFFVAKGRFNIGRTCNVWLGQVLRRAGLPFGIWTPTPQAVALSLSRFSSQE